MRVHLFQAAGVWLLAGGALWCAAAQKPADDKPRGEVTTPPAKGERHPDKLQVGDPAPDFTLPDPSGKKEVKLSGFQGKKPVVLVFGSHT